MRSEENIQINAIFTLIIEVVILLSMWIIKKKMKCEIQRSDAGVGAKRARYFKQDEKGVAIMCKIMEDMRNEAAKKAVLETAERMIKKGKMSLEEIADYVPALSLDELKELESEIMHLA